MKKKKEKPRSIWLGKFYTFDFGFFTWRSLYMLLFMKDLNLVVDIRNKIGSWVIVICIWLVPKVVGFSCDHLG